MDYSRVYDQFMTDRRLREAELCDYETHHVLPKHLGGTDSPDNLIRLSLEDHLFAHLLLGRIHGGWMAQCYLRMSGMKKYRGGRGVRTRFKSLRLAAKKTLQQSWTPERRAARSEEYRQNPDKVHPPGWSEKTSAALKGRPPKPEVIAASVAVNRGRKWSDAERAYHERERATRPHPMKGRRHTPETKLKLRLDKLGKKRSPEATAKWKASMAKHWNKNSASAE